MEQAQLAKREWLLHCDKARQPEYVSQNEMDMILDALTSWNRKKKDIVINQHYNSQGVQSDLNSLYFYEL